MEFETENLIQHERMSGEVRRITYRNDENGYSIVKMWNTQTKREDTVTGVFGAVAEGQCFQLFGTWTRHPQYGPQFKVERAVPELPSSKEGIQRYLASGALAGVGEKTAAKIVDHFGIETLNILNSAPQRLGEVAGLGRRQRSKLLASWRDNTARQEIFAFLTGHGMTPGLSHKIYNLYGADTVALISENPYRLAQDLHGIGFKRADEIARSLGIALDSRERITAAIYHHLQLAEDQGHCFLTQTQLVAQLSEALAIGHDDLLAKIIACIADLKAQNLVFEDEYQHGTLGYIPVYYRFRTYLAEAQIAQRLTRLLNHSPKVDLDRVHGWLARVRPTLAAPLSAEQEAAVIQAVSQRVFVLTGGPGVGKTTTANMIIRLFKAMGNSVSLCAPTGRAAQRLSEVSGDTAKTIHRLLGWNPQLRGFAHDDTDPLPAQVVVVDEASMLDVHLADALLRAIPVTSQVIFIGDIDQLPSVGPGSVLGDMIQAGMVPFVKLSQIFRQAAASAIVRSAHAINQGALPEFQNGTDCEFIPCGSPEAVRAEIEKILIDRIPQHTDFDPVRDIQILTPMNKGDVGTQSLNIEIQNLLNPAGKRGPELKRFGQVFREGDKVIQTVNNYELNVFNGDIGFVTHCAVQGGKLIVNFAERTVEFKDEQIADLRLAYAITIHKSQGSEFPVVIIPLTMQHYVMLQRNLVYTGLTRAKKLAIFVGSMKALQHAVNTQTSKRRQSLLLERLRSCPA